jgi:hypothetical protein
MWFVTTTKFSWVPPWWPRARTGTAPATPPGRTARRAAPSSPWRLSRGPASPPERKHAVLECHAVSAMKAEFTAQFFFTMLPYRAQRGPAWTAAWQTSPLCVVALVQPRRHRWKVGHVRPRLRRRRTCGRQVHWFYPSRSCWGTPSVRSQMFVAINIWDESQSGV